MSGGGEQLRRRVVEEPLGRRVRIEDVEISDAQRNYGRRYAASAGGSAANPVPVLR